MDIFEKISEFGFKRIRTVQKIEENNFSVEFLLSEKKRLEDSLLEIEQLLLKAKELGLNDKKETTDVLQDK